MLGSTIELINLATSNSHVVFCFCNLIIACLLLGSSSSSSSRTRHDHNPQHKTIFSSSGADRTWDEEYLAGELKAAEAFMIRELAEEGSPAPADESDGKGEYEEEDEEDEDQLRRRIEDFIEKMNGRLRR